MYNQKLQNLIPRLEAWLDRTLPVTAQQAAFRKTDAQNYFDGKNKFYMAVLETGSCDIAAVATVETNVVDAYLRTPDAKGLPPEQIQDFSQWDFINRELPKTDKVKEMLAEVDRLEELGIPGGDNERLNRRYYKLGEDLLVAAIEAYLDKIEKR